MRHRRKTIKLGRSTAHRDSLLANQVCSLIEHHRIKTTLAKAKAAKPLAERMVTLGKRGDLHARRTAISYLKQKDIVKILFEKIAPAAASRQGGYTRITKLGPRQSDSAPMAYLEWVDKTLEAVTTAPTAKALVPAEEVMPTTVKASKAAAPAAKAKADKKVSEPKK
jgi:large subunit ribosomal protein L17